MNQISHETVVTSPYDVEVIVELAERSITPIDIYTNIS